MGHRPPAPAARDRERSRAVAFRLAESEQRLFLLVRFLRHDVRSPLTILLGHSEMLAEGLIPQAAWPGAFAAMQRQATVLNARLDQLGAGALPPGQRLLWVGCGPEDATTAREALGDLLVYIGDPDECAYLSDPDEPLLCVEPGWSHAVIRREAEQRLGQRGG